MNAREDLIELMTYGVHSDREANEAIDAYAHELAEKIRKANENPVEWTVYNGGMRDAADLIDPEAATSLPGEESSP